MVAASNGELRVVSARGIGTRIQIEWPVAAMKITGRGDGTAMRERAPNAEQNPAVVRAIVQTLGEIGLSAGTGMEERQGAH